MKIMLLNQQKEALYQVGLNATAHPTGAASQTIWTWSNKRL